MRPTSSPRRHLLRQATLGGAAIAFPSLWLGARAAAPAARIATPSQTEGPFYPVQLPADSDADLLANGTLRYTRGQAVDLGGRVVDLDGRPLKGGRIEIWQCDQDGRYHHPGDGGRADPAFQGYGQVQLDAEGRYRFRTLRPAAYTGRTPHIHVKVRLDRRELLTTQLYVEGDPGNARDSLWRRLSEAERAALTVPFRPAADGLQAAFEIVVAA